MKNIKNIIIFSIFIWLFVATDTTYAVTFSIATSNGSTSVTANTNKSIYAPGDDISVTGNFITNDPHVYTAYLSASTNGGAPVDVIAYLPLPAVNTVRVATAGAPGGPFTMLYHAGVNEIVSVSCGTFLSGSYGAPNSFYVYPETIINFGTNYGPTRIDYDVYDVPNRFTVKRYSDGAFVASTGWLGTADYSGPWGKTPFDGSPSVGSISFTTTERFYQFIVKTTTGPIMADSWGASTLCP